MKTLIYLALTLSIITTGFTAEELELESASGIKISLDYNTKHTVSGYNGGCENAIVKNLVVTSSELGEKIVAVKAYLKNDLSDAGKLVEFTCLEGTCQTSEEFLAETSSFNCSGPGYRNILPNGEVTYNQYYGKFLNVQVKYENTNEEQWINQLDPIRKSFEFLLQF